MIKKISQLNRLPEQFYKENLFSDDKKETMLRKKNEMLFEVSYETADTSKPYSADEINYYTSYSTTLSALGDMLGIEAIRSLLSTIAEGGLSVISGGIRIGQAGDSTPDRVDSYNPDPDLEHSVNCYSNFRLENNLLVHGETTFHNDIKIMCDADRGREDPDRPILDVTGVAKFNQTIYGTAYRAQWADLAEIYAADAEYAPGTLIAFGGENEVTIAKDKVNGVVTSKPAVILNGEESTNMAFPTGIALVGRVPVRVRGPVKKFDKIVLSKTDPGVGVVYNYALPYEIIGVALEENGDESEKLVLCATKTNLN